MTIKNVKKKYKTIKSSNYKLIAFVLFTPQSTPMSSHHTMHHIQSSKTTTRNIFKCFCFFIVSYISYCSFIISPE